MLLNRCRGLTFLLNLCTLMFSCAITLPTPISLLLLISAFSDLFGKSTIVGFFPSLSVFFFYIHLSTCTGFLSDLLQHSKSLSPSSDSTSQVLSFDSQKKPSCFRFLFYAPIYFFLAFRFAFVWRLMTFLASMISKI